MSTMNTEKEDVEKEDVEKEDKSGDEITKPFNPNMIDVDIATINLGSMIEELENNEIDLQPDFQRSSDVWTPTQKSRLIESILLGLPLPSFYFSEDSTTQKRLVIDGLQRLCAIKNFVIEKNLKLQDLQFLKKFEGKSFDELERPEIKRIKALKITTNTLRKNTPSEVKYIIFQRVNTAGVPLEPQEMRHALNQGAAAKFIMELAKTESFKNATCNSIKEKRMLDCDFANRFVAFFIGLDEYTGELDSFLNDQMGKLNKMTEVERESIKDAFNRSMICCLKIFGDDAFRKRQNFKDNRKPISKAVFDTISVNIAHLTPDKQNHLVEKTNEFKSGLVNLFNESSFWNAVSTGTGKKSTVEIRFRKVKQLIEDILI